MFKDFTDFIIVTLPPDTVISKLWSLKKIKERPDYHPEESAFHHVRIVTERLFVTNDIDLIFAGALHDIFKAKTAKINEKTGYITCPGHDKLAAEFVLDDPDVFEWITKNGGDPKTVSSLCGDHMRFHQFGEMKKSKQREFISRPHWDKLKILGAADNMLVEFDLDDLEKSWKWNRNKEE